MDIKLSRFDAAEYLDDDEACVEFLKAAMEGNDIDHILSAINVVARAKGMTKIAAEAGVGRESLYKSLRADGNPSFGTIMRVLHALGVRLTAEPLEAA